MLHLHGQLPDEIGATVEATLTRLTEQMRPVKGQPWDTFERRAADALHLLCDGSAGEAGQEHTPRLAPQPVLQGLIPLQGPAEIAGIPIADTVLEQLRANATIEPVLVDDDGVPIAIGKRFRAVSPKIARAVVLRDHHCRVCGGNRGLQIHHLRPRSWGGSDDLANLAVVCARDHRQLVPHGPWALLGNPNQPDGLQRVHLDHLVPEQLESLGLPPDRNQRHRE
jgi:hypothetical protein